ncbi:MAG: VOC family protein [Acidimicrobiia bacterium]
MNRSIQIVFDANDPKLVGEFWLEALGYITQPPPPDFASWEDWAKAMEIPEERWNDAMAIVDPEDTRPRVFIQKVPEGKTAKNRVHLDVSVSGGPSTPIDDRKRLIDEEADRLAQVGGTIVHPIEQRDEYWVVMTDPEGNEFCVH